MLIALIAQVIFVVVLVVTFSSVLYGDKEK